MDYGRMNNMNGAEIKLGHPLGNDPCALCGRYRERDQGLEFFVTNRNGDDQVVCPWCARTEVPDGLWNEYHAEKLKAELLGKYAQCKPKEFFQIDGFVDDFDSIIVPNEHGVGLISMHTVELMRCRTAVRILIEPGADREKVATILTDAAEWVKQEETLLEMRKHPIGPLDPPKCPTCGHLDNDEVHPF